MMLYLQVILKLRSNTLAWNPMEAFVFTVANEDYKYVFFNFGYKFIGKPLIGRTCTLNSTMMLLG